MALKKNIVFNVNLPLGAQAKTMYDKVDSLEKLVELAFYFCTLNDYVVNIEFKKYSYLYFLELYKEATGKDFDKIIIRA